MFKRLGAIGIVGILALLGGIVLIGLENPIIAAGIGLVVTGLGLVAFGMVRNLMKAFGMA